MEPCLATEDKADQTLERQASPRASVGAQRPSRSVVRGPSVPTQQLLSVLTKLTEFRPDVLDNQRTGLFQNTVQFASDGFDCHSTPDTQPDRASSHSINELCTMFFKLNLFNPLWRKICCVGGETSSSRERCLDSEHSQVTQKKNSGSQVENLPNVAAELESSQTQKPPFMVATKSSAPWKLGGHLETGTARPANWPRTADSNPAVSTTVAPTLQDPPVLLPNVPEVYQRVADTAMKIFLGQQPETAELEAFKPYEWEVLVHVLEAKIGLKSATGGASARPEKLAGLCAELLRCRPFSKESNTRFVFKAAQRLMMRAQARALGLPEPDPARFCEEHFAAAAREKGLSLNDFWDPRSRAAPLRDPESGRLLPRGPGRRSFFSSINSKFVSLVLSVPSYRNAFLDVLCSTAFEDLVRNKLIKQLSRLLIAAPRPTDTPTPSEASSLTVRLEAFFASSNSILLPRTLAEARLARTQFLYWFFPLHSRIQPSSINFSS